VLAPIFEGAEAPLLQSILCFQSLIGLTSALAGPNLRLSKAAALLLNFRKSLRNWAMVRVPDWVITGLPHPSARIYAFAPSWSARDRCSEAEGGGAD